MSLQAVGYEPHGSPCSSLSSSLSRKRSREYAGFAEFTTPPPSRRSSREADDRTVSKCPMTYHTPPASDTGSPAIKAESFPGSWPLIETDDSLCVRLKDEAEQQSDGNSPVKLPGLDQFDQGVRALGDNKSSPTTNTSPQTLPSFKAVFSPQLPALQPYAATEPSPSTSASTSTSYYPVTSPSNTNPHPYSSPVYQTPRTALTPPFSAFTTPDLPPEELYPHVQPKVRNKHCNKKYTVEEGDFIIYLWHDKKLKWEQVRNEFANIFGREPYRTTQGLQAWYYRMNGVIPCWDKDGYLIFDNDDILEPRNRQIKVRDQERGEVDPEPLGLAQRYPERGMAYRWVEHKDKVAMSDWAAKRIQQFNERRERRRQKEDRRAAGLQEATAPRHIQQAAGPSYRSYL